jgi:peptidoglycan/xylan/chitin deacetylase (PgdA/CDA1 family)
MLKIENMITKKNLKMILCFAVYYSGALHIYLKYFFLRRKEYPAVIINYHGFMRPGVKTMEDVPIVRVAIDDFCSQLKFLKRYFSIVTLDTIVKNLNEKKLFDKPTIAITVDDGYKDNYDLLFPVLKENGASATIFLVTGFIGTDQKIWTERLLHLITHSKVKELVFEELYPGEEFEMSSWDGKKHAYIRFKHKLKDFSLKKRNEYIDEISRRLGNPPVNFGPTMLNWDQVREMADAGIVFGAHTVRHPILSKIPIEEAKEEIVFSKEKIEEELGTMVRHFAYPNGLEEDFSIGLAQYCRQIGFESISTCSWGKNQTKEDVWALKRIGSELPLANFAVNLIRFF